MDALCRGRNLHKYKYTLKASFKCGQTAPEQKDTIWSAVHLETYTLREGFVEAQSWVNYHFGATKATQFFSESGSRWAVICLGALGLERV